MFKKFHVEGNVVEGLFNAANPSINKDHLLTISFSIA